MVTQAMVDAVRSAHHHIAEETSALGVLRDSGYTVENGSFDAKFAASELARYIGIRDAILAKYGRQMVTCPSCEANFPLSTFTASGFPAHRFCGRVCKG